MVSPDLRVGLNPALRVGTDLRVGLNPSRAYLAAMEEPELLAEDIRIWFRAFRGRRGT